MVALGRFVLRFGDLGVVVAVFGLRFNNVFLFVKGVGFACVHRYLDVVLLPLDSL